MFTLCEKTMKRHKDQFLGGRSATNGATDGHINFLPLKPNPAAENPPTSISLIPTEIFSKFQPEGRPRTPTG